MNNRHPVTADAIRAAADKRCAGRARGADGARSAPGSGTVCPILLQPGTACRR